MRMRRIVLFLVVVANVKIDRRWGELQSDWIGVVRLLGSLIFASFFYCDRPVLNFYKIIAFTLTHTPRMHECSKVPRDTLYEAVRSVLQGSQEKKRKFTETVELQISLKNYDPQKDKRFSGTVK